MTKDPPLSERVTYLIAEVEMLKADYARIVERLREPTPEMIEAGWEAFCNLNADSEAPRDIFTAMSEAMLKGDG